MKTEGRRIHDLFLVAKCPNLAEMAMWFEYYQGQGCWQISFTLDPHQVMSKLGGSIFNLKSLSFGHEPWNKEMLNEPWAKELSPALRAIYERREETPGEYPLVLLAKFAEEIDQLTDDARVYLEGVAEEYVQVSILCEVEEESEPPEGFF